MLERQAIVAAPRGESGYGLGSDPSFSTILAANWEQSIKDGPSQPMGARLCPCRLRPKAKLSATSRMSENLGVHTLDRSLNLN